jgi:ferredoxin-NADP reductase
MENNSKKIWYAATLTDTGIVAEGIRMMRFYVPGFGIHKAGQHVDVRLTASNGYVAQRSYSIANAPDPNMPDIIELGVQILENGEVSPYLWNMVPGGKIEVRGPLGGHFIWEPSMPGPLVVIGGGSGMVPLMGMLRVSDIDRDILIMLSARSKERMPYMDELIHLSKERNRRVKLVMTLTDQVPEGWGYQRGRIDRKMIEKEILGMKGKMPMIYICGPTGFV